MRCEFFYTKEQENIVVSWEGKMVGVTVCDTLKPGLALTGRATEHDLIG
jgi:hypothetical protein